MKTASWVIVSRETGNAVWETFSLTLAERVNRDKYDVVPILQWLQSLNKKAEAGARP